MALFQIWKVKWFATPNSDPMTYYFRDDKNIDSTFQEWNHPNSFYTKEIILVDENSTYYKMCLDG